jgi:class 3 adenylate cyclase
VHTGEPLLAEEGYVGHDVHRAARIAAAGHGGQVLPPISVRTTKATRKTAGWSSK